MNLNVEICHEASMHWYKTSSCNVEILSVSILLIVQYDWLFSRVYLQKNVNIQVVFFLMFF